MSPAPKADSLIPKPDGRLILTLDGVPYTLRRPTIGEQWMFDESYASVIETERADVEWAQGVLGDHADEVNDAAARPGSVLSAVRHFDPQEAMKRKQVRQRALLSWWVEVFEKLCSNLPGPVVVDDLPPFLTDFANVGLAQEAWARNPQGPGDE